MPLQPRLLPGLLLALSSLACAPAAPPPAAPSPAAPARVGLAGLIWDVAAHKAISRAELDARLARADYVLLGEKHDDPEHHLLQAELLRSVVAAGKKPEVAFEMIDAEQQAAVETCERAGPCDLADLARTLDWERSGWPPFAQYEPILREAFGAHLRVVAANLPKKTIRDIVRDVDGARARWAHDLDVGEPLPAPLAEPLKEEMREAHCGMLPEAMVEPMAIAQRVRDATMATAMLRAPSAVLIAGSGHARKDRGVPREILRRRPSAQVLSVAFVEVDAAAATPRAPDGYGARWLAPSPPFDVLWFTAPMPDDDPCAKMRAPKP